MLVDILLERRTMAYLESVGGKYSTHLMQQILYGIVFAIALGTLGFFTMGGLTIATMLLAIGGIFIGFKMSYILLIQEIGKRKQIRIEQFPVFLNYFSALVVVNNLNVVNTIGATINYLNEPMKTEVTKLHKKLMLGEGRDAFLEFSRFIGTADALMVIGVLSDFNEYGVDTMKLKELESTVNKLNDAIIDEKIIRQATKIESFANYSLFGVIGFVFMFVGILFVQIFSELNF